jgi:hypothetical protein
MASFNYTKHFLNKIEDLYSETDFHLRYERGHFKSGYCVLKNQKIAIVNKYYSLEGKINSLIEMLKEIEVDENKLSPKNKKLYLDLSQITELS